MQDSSDSKHSPHPLSFPLLDRLLEGAQVIGPDWRYLYLNDAALAHCRATREQLVGRRLLEVWPGVEGTALLAHLRQCMEERAARQLKAELTLVDGSKGWFQLKVVPIDEGVLILSHELEPSERRQAEEQLRQIEWMLSGQLTPSVEEADELVQRDYGDLVELNERGLILHSVGRETLISIASDYLDLLGTSTAIYERDGQYALGIFSSGWCRLLDSASRDLCDTTDNTEALTSGRWLCHESCWTDCCQRVIREEKPVDIECHGGLRMYGVPIVANSEVIGAINIGYGDPPRSRERLREIAEAYRLDPERLRRQAEAYHSRPTYIIELAKKRLHVSAHLLGTMVENVQREEELRQRNQFIQTILDNLPIGLAVNYLESGTATYINQRFAEIYGWPAEELKDIPRFFEKVYPDPDLRRELQARVMADIESGDPERMSWAGLEATGKDGSKKIISAKNIPLFEQNLMISTVQDITESSKAAEELARSEAKARAMYQGLPIATFVWQLKPEGYLLVDFNDAALALTKGGVRGAVNEPLGLLCSDHPDIVDDVQRCFERQSSFRREITYFCRSHEREQILVITYGFVPPDMVLLHAEDVTERRKIEEQIQTGQRLKAIGQLAGGVAHDFNNLLTVINSYSELALDEILESDPLRNNFAQILSAGERAAALTQQLLAFSRKQVMAPKVLDLNSVIRGLENMLRRLLGEDIQIVVQLTGDQAQVRADPGQLEQVIINLAVNARDAMVGGGTLRLVTTLVSLEAEALPPSFPAESGDFVLLTVTDTGCGIDEETKRHIFEPFFTTKEKGKGTGLGLATVYGVVKQSGGNIAVFSEPGAGTSFEIALPQVLEAASTAVPQPRHLSNSKGNETILLVEDEHAVRLLAERVLLLAGYTVITASGGREALQLCEAHAHPPHLLLTDVVMPQMSGKELADRLLQLLPEVKVLFMSGYTADTIGHHDVLTPGTRFIGKPFTARELTRKVREVLDEEPTGA